MPLALSLLNFLLFHASYHGYRPEKYNSSCITIESYYKLPYSKIVLQILHCSKMAPNYLIELCGRKLGIRTMYCTFSRIFQHARERSNLDLNMRVIPNSPNQTPQASGYLPQTCTIFERKCFHHLNQMENTNLNHNLLDIQVRPYQWMCHVALTLINGNLEPWNKDWQQWS